ncbi:MAG: Uma2 family endonuclease [Hormoscilla sp. GM7CHS1pb]|nr:Uma2 family endonuclease [Hormoscilla sp. GM7CHS1pb]
MVKSIASTGLSWEEFVAEYGDNERYELIDGELIDMEPTGPHEQVAALIGRKLNVEIERGDLPYFIPYRCLIRPLGIASAFRPDVVVLDSEALVSEPLWNREPVVTMGGATAKLVVEVVSTNWQNDYARKYEDYEALGIAEYWIVDYLGLGGKYYIGSPKQPAITICNLVDGEYQKVMLRSGNFIQSLLFPDLKLSADKLFAFGGV